MPRIRTIKPEFWTSAQVLECSTNARLLFIGLWNFADDAGRHPDSAKQIKAEVFPADDFDLSTVQGMLDELSRNGLVTRYVVDGKGFLAITGWHHQRIDKPQPAKYPGPELADSENIPRTLPPDRKGKDRKGEESCTAAAPPDDDPKPAWFAEFRAQYPRRGGDPNWRGALRAGQARIREGHRPDELVDGARRYARFIAATGKVGTEFVQQASRFLGPGKPFALPWEPPVEPTGASNGRKSFEQIQSDLAAIAPR